VEVLSAPQRRLMPSGERMNDSLDDLLDFSVRQRTVGMLERQPDRQADLAVRHALPMVPIELTH